MELKPLTVEEALARLKRIRPRLSEQEQRVKEEAIHKVKKEEREQEQELPNKRRKESTETKEFVEKKTTDCITLTKKDGADDIVVEEGIDEVESMDQTRQAMHTFMALIYKNPFPENVDAFNIWMKTAAKQIDNLDKLLTPYTAKIRRDTLNFCYDVYFGMCYGKLHTAKDILEKSYFERILKLTISAMEHRISWARNELFLMKWKYMKSDLEKMRAAMAISSEKT